LPQREEKDGAGPGGAEEDAVTAEPELLPEGVCASGRDCGAADTPPDPPEGGTFGFAGSGEKGWE
jgi:hypothetical protein